MVGHAHACVTGGWLGGMRGKGRAREAAEQACRPRICVAHPAETTEAAQRAQGPPTAGWYVQPTQAPSPLRHDSDTSRTVPSPMACLPMADWYVLRGDWLWSGKGTMEAHTPGAAGAGHGLVAGATRSSTRAAAGRAWRPSSAWPSRRPAGAARSCPQQAPSRRTAGAQRAHSRPPAGAPRIMAGWISQCVYMLMLAPCPAAAAARQGRVGGWVGAGQHGRTTRRPARPWTGHPARAAGPAPRCRCHAATRPCARPCSAARPCGTTHPCVRPAGPG